jgi:hypothetical protein
MFSLLLFFLEEFSIMIADFFFFILSRHIVLIEFKVDNLFEFVIYKVMMVSKKNLNIELKLDFVK